MSDEELDREWKPSARPQSTMARSFSLALNDLFKIDNSVADLDAAVSEKKKALSSQTSELEELEARLKATEERLRARQAASTSPTQSPNAGGRSSPRPRIPLGDSTFKQPSSQPNSPLAERFGNGKPPSRPATRGSVADGAENQVPPRPVSSRKEVPSMSMPGALPPTPGASEGEYVLVERVGTSADYVVIDKDGDDPTLAADAAAAAATST